MNILENVLPVLKVAQAAFTGNPVPGREAAITGVVALAEMVSTMKANMDELPDLIKRLKPLTEIDAARFSDDLEPCLDMLKENLKPHTNRLTSLKRKSKLKQFFKGKKYEREIQGIKASIASHIQDFTFHNSVLIKKVVDKMSKKAIQKVEPQVEQNFKSVQEIAPEVRDINNTVKDVNNAAKSEHVEKALAQINHVSASYNASNTPDKCIKETRVKILQDITARLMAPYDPSQHIVMLSGSVGTGKSTIAKSIASTLAEESHTLAASFFFRRNDAGRDEIKDLPLTLAYQLAHYDADFKNILVDFLDGDHTILDAGPHMQWQKLVVDLLAQIPPSKKIWVICLDALDECGQDRGKIFLQWLSSSIKDIPDHVRFFLTGRPDVPFYLKDDELHLSMHEIILDNTDKKTVEDDIRRYVEQSLDGSSWTPQSTWTPQTHDIDMITRLANGLFIFAATAVHYVRENSARVNPQKSLDDFLQGGGRGDLEEIYFQIVNEAIPMAPGTDPLDQELYSDSMNILSTILELFQPMDCKGLAGLLDLEEDSVRRALVLLSAVIHAPETGAVQILHLSFREFMVSQESKLYLDRADLLCGTQKQRQEFASRVLQKMQTELKFNICELPTSHLKNAEMPGLKQKLDICIPNYLRYCCCFWVDHLVALPSNAKISGIAKDFLEAKCLFWLEVLSLLGMVSTASLALSRFILWNDDATGRQFAADIKRFIRFFGPAITQSTPHLYVTALAFAPVQSEVGLKFRSQFPGLLSISTGLMEKWPATLGVLEGHFDRVTSVAFSPDGRLIVFGSHDSTVRLWDAESGAPLDKPLEGHTDLVTSVAFSPHVKYIVSGSHDCTVRLWDAKSGAPLGKPLEGHTDSVASVAFSPDGKYIVSGSHDCTVRLWDAESGAPLGEPLEGHTDLVASVAFSPHGKYIVSGSHDCTVHLWDVKSGAPLGEPLEGHTGAVASVAFSPDARHIVSGSHDCTARLWDAESGAPLGEPLEGHTEWVASVAFSPDGKHIVSGSYDNTVRLWDAKSGAPLGKPLEGHTEWVASVAFSPDGRHIVSGSHDCTVRLWDAKSGPPLGKPLEGHTNGITSVAFSPGGTHIVSGSHDSTVRLWDAESGAPQGEPLEGHTDSVRSVAFSPDGKHIVSGSDDGTVHLWDAESGAPLGEPLEGHTGMVASVAFSPDGKHIVSGSYDNTVCLWDAESGAPLGKPLEGHTGVVTSVAFSPDGKHIVSGSDDCTVCLWDAESGAPLGKPLEGHTGVVASVTFSPDGKHIVSGSYDNTVRFWDAKGGAPLGKPLEGHTGEVTSVAFSPDGKHIVSGSYDSTVHLWDAESGAPLGKPLEGHTGSVRSVAFSPDGKHIVSGSSDCTVRLWYADSGAPLGDPLQGHTDWVPSVAFSLDGKHSDPGSQDALQVSHSKAPPFQSDTAISYRSNSIKPEIPYGSPYWTIQQGWVLSSTHELLFWLPHEHRIGFWMPLNKLIIGRQQTLLSYNKFVYGTEWAKCYLPSLAGHPK